MNKTITEDKQKAISARALKQQERANRKEERANRKEERWERSQQALEQGHDVYARQIIWSWVQIPCIHFWYSLLYIVISFLWKATIYVISGRIIVESWQRALVWSGYVSEAALGISVIWGIANHVATIHNVFVNNTVINPFVDNLNAFMMASFTLIPDLILASAILMVFTRLTECFQKKGKEQAAAIVWAILYTGCTITFLCLTLYTLNTITSVASSGDVSQVVFASGNELKIRVTSSAIYALCETIHFFLGMKAKKQEKHTTEEQGKKITEQQATITQLETAITQLQGSLQQEQQQRQLAEARHNEEVTRLLQKHVEEQAALSQEKSRLAHQDQQTLAGLQSRHQQELTALRIKHEHDLAERERQYQQEKTDLQIQLSTLQGRVEEMQKQPTPKKSNAAHLFNMQPVIRQNTTQPLTQEGGETSEQEAGENEPRPAFTVENLYEARKTTYMIPELGTFYTLAYAAKLWGMEGDDKGIIKKVRRFLKQNPQFWMLSIEGNSEFPYWYIQDKAKNTFQKEFGLRKERAS